MKVRTKRILSNNSPFSALSSNKSIKGFTKNSPVRMQSARVKYKNEPESGKLCAHTFSRCDQLTFSKQTELSN